MSTGLTLFSLFLLYTVVLRPLLRFEREKRVRQEARRFRNFQLICVKEHYPAAWDLSYEELQARYNIARSYENIGRL